jgi:hypothetical protein
MGKNTMMKRSIRLYCEETGNDQWAPLLDLLVGNVGLVFTKADLGQVRAALWARGVRRLARAGRWRRTQCATLEGASPCNGRTWRLRPCRALVLTGARVKQRC